MGENRQNKRAERRLESVDADCKVKLNKSEKLFIIIAAAVMLLSVSVIIYIRSAEPEGIDILSVPEAYSYDLTVINTATAEDFMSVKGIGEVKARAIINFRDSIGGFTDINQIKHLDGISDKLLANIIEHFYGSPAED